ncbi:hypothetical protein [Pseudomonas sp. TH10]|uniref:hypothetical protein n=1 Tax=Pseudomonas sp. TH10 TaxID=2796376 RepID=UPI001A92C721|nr:hypothetical protein [Pseudomonas sp. TH10]
MKQQNPVGAAAGCDLLMSLKNSKDRSRVSLDSAYSCAHIRQLPNTSPVKQLQNRAKQY